MALSSTSRHHRCYERPRDNGLWLPALCNSNSVIPCLLVIACAGASMSVLPLTMTLLKYGALLGTGEYFFFFVLSHCKVRSISILACVFFEPICLYRVFFTAVCLCMMTCHDMDYSVLRNVCE